MKILTIILSVFALSVFSFSCQKCKKCTVTTVQSYQGFNQTISAPTTDYCGDDYDNAPAEGEVISNAGGGVTQTVTTSCTDK